MLVISVHIIFAVGWDRIWNLIVAKKSFTYTGIGIWSSIDPTIRSIPNYHLFVTKLKHKHQEEQSYHH